MHGLSKLLRDYSSLCFVSHNYHNSGTIRALRRQSRASWHIHATWRRKENPISKEATCYGHKRNNANYWFRSVACSTEYAYQLKYPVDIKILKNRVAAVLHPQLMLRVFSFVSIPPNPFAHFSLLSHNFDIN